MRMIDLIEKKKEKIELTKTEFAILWLLCENRGSVVKSDTLFSTVWKEDYLHRNQ